MEIGMSASFDEAAATAFSAWPGGRIGIVTKETGGKVEPEGRLADARRTRDDDRVRRVAGDHRPDGRGCGPMTAGQEARHRRGQAVSAFLRVVRRLGAGASTASGPPGTSVEPVVVASSDDAGDADADVVALARVVRRFGAGGVVASSSAAASEAVDAVFLVVRRFVAGSAAERGPAVDPAVEVSPDLRRVVLRFGAASGAATGVEAADSIASGSGATSGDSGLGVAALPDWANWALSICSSSSGTSLQGSLDRGPAGLSGRSGRG
jgi:hypothetical protein